MATELINLQAKNLSAWVAELIDEVKELQSDVEALQEAQGGDDSSIPAIQSRLTAVETQLTSLSATVSTNTGNISTLQTTVSSLQTTVSTLQSTLTSLQNRVNTAQVLHFITISCVEGSAKVSIAGIIKNTSTTAFTLSSLPQTALQSMSGTGYYTGTFCNAYYNGSDGSSELYIELGGTIGDVSFDFSNCTITDEVINLSL